MRDIVVIGVGNEFGGDDAAGLLVARRLKEIVHGGVIVLEHSGDGAALMELWEDAESVVLIDASGSGAVPGTIQRFDASAKPLPARSVRHSSHAFGVPEAIETSRALKQLPPHVIVYAIEGRNFAAGAPVSPEVEAAIPISLERVTREVEGATGN